MLSGLIHFVSITHLYITLQPDVSVVFKHTQPFVIVISHYHLRLQKHPFAEEAGLRSQVFQAGKILTLLFG